MKCTFCDNGTRYDSAGKAVGPCSFCGTSGELGSNVVILDWPYEYDFLANKGYKHPAALRKDHPTKWALVDEKGMLIFKMMGTPEEAVDQLRIIAKAIKSLADVKVGYE